MKVVFTDAALSDLDANADWIGLDSWDAAEAIRSAAAGPMPRPRPAPEPLPLRRGIAVRNLRKLAYHGYLIFYQVTTAVEIVHILQGSRDWEAVLKDDLGPD